MREGSPSAPESSSHHLCRRFRHPLTSCQSRFLIDERLVFIVSFDEDGGTLSMDYSYFQSRVLSVRYPVTGGAPAELFLYE